jgi:hypothetical protein
MLNTKNNPMLLGMIIQNPWHMRNCVPVNIPMPKNCLYKHDTQISRLKLQLLNALQLVQITNTSIVTTTRFMMPGLMCLGPLPPTMKQGALSLSAKSNKCSGITGK